MNVRTEIGVMPISDVINVRKKQSREVRPLW